jgi:hypothetical protein
LQDEKGKNGKLDVMISPKSALDRSMSVKGDANNF